MKIAFILSLFLHILVVGGILLADSTDLIVPSSPPVQDRAKIVPPESLSVPPSLPSVEGKKKITPEENPLIPPSLTPVGEKPKNISPETNLIVPTPPMVQEKPKNVPRENILEVPSLQKIQDRQVNTPPFEPLQVPQLNDVNLPSIVELNDFRGGLNLVSFPTHVGKNEAIELENALWNPQGELYKRPGYTICDPSIDGINFLYRYYKEQPDSNGCYKYRIVGNDTALWYAKMDSCTFHYLTGTGGISGRWDGCTYKNKFVGTHEGIFAIVWDGDTLSYLIGMATDSIRSQPPNGLIPTNIGYRCPFTGVPSDTEGCASCTLVVTFNEQGWETNKWIGYTAVYKTLSDPWGRRDFIVGNTSNVLYIRAGHSSGIILPGAYFSIYGWFGTDTVWREGTIDSVAPCYYYYDSDHDEDDALVRVFDSSFVWDSTFSYKDYVFEITGASNVKVWLCDYWNFFCLWDTRGFIVPAYTHHCFQKGDKYKIYKIGFYKGSKFCESYDDHLWLAWTGLGEQQNKNILLWSNLNDIGSWDPENHIIIESPDGDFITGMKTFSGSYVDVPRDELIVGQNNALYKVVPNASDLGYDIWTIATGVGVASNATMSTAEGKVMLFADQHGVFAYDRQNVQPIGKKIDPIIKEQDKTLLEKASAIYDPETRTYYLSYDPIDTLTTTLVVSWNDARATHSPGYHQYHIYCQRINCLGHLLGNVIQVDDSSTDYNRESAIGMDEDRNFIIVWRADPENTSPYSCHVYGQRFYANGEKNGEQFQISHTQGAMFPAVDMNSSGEFAVVWQDTVTDFAYVRFYDSNGQAKNDSSRVSDSLHWDANPYIELDDNGQSVITFGASYSSESGSGARFQRYDDTVKVDTNIYIVTTGYIYPRIAGKSDGTFILTFESTDPHRVYFQRFNSDATPIDTLILVPYDGLPDEEATAPMPAMDEDGNFVISWYDSRNGDPLQADIYIQKFDNNADPIDTNIRITPSPIVDISFGFNCPDMIYLEGGHVVPWCHNPMSGITVGGDYIGSPLLISDYGVCLEANDAQVEGRGGTCLTIGDYSLAWSIDYGGWSKESFDAKAYCYQHSVFDSTKILFSDGENICYYGESQTDNGDPVILTYQSPYFRFSQYPWQVALISYATIESYGSGDLILEWYSDYGTLIATDTLTISGYDLQSLEQNGDIEGKNISLKITTSADDFKLSGYWLEYVIDKSRR
jgi:hypothetical protein